MLTQEPLCCGSVMINNFSMFGIVAVNEYLKNIYKF